MADPVEFELLVALKSTPEDRRPELQMLYHRQKKDRTIALLLHCLIFIGLPGMGRLYVGDIAIGVLQLIFTYFSCGILVLWPLVDLLFVMGAADNYNRIVLRRCSLVAG